MLQDLVPLGITAVIGCGHVVFSGSFDGGIDIIVQRRRIAKAGHGGNALHTLLHGHHESGGRPTDNGGAGRQAQRRRVVAQGIGGKSHGKVRRIDLQGTASYYTLQQHVPKTFIEFIVAQRRPVGMAQREHNAVFHRFTLSGIVTLIAFQHPVQRGDKVLHHLSGARHQMPFVGKLQETGAQVLVAHLRIPVHRYLHGLVAVVQGCNAIRITQDNLIERGSNGRCCSRRSIRKHPFRFKSQFRRRMVVIHLLETCRNQGAVKLLGGNVGATVGRTAIQEDRCCFGGNVHLRTRIQMRMGSSGNLGKGRQGHGVETGLVRARNALVRGKRHHHNVGHACEARFRGNLRQRRQIGFGGLQRGQGKGQLHRTYLCFLLHRAQLGTGSHTLQQNNCQGKGNKGMDDTHVHSTNLRRATCRTSSPAQRLHRQPSYCPRAAGCRPYTG